MELTHSFSYSTTPELMHPYSFNPNIPPRIRNQKVAKRCSLPKPATKILKEWLLKNWASPYPSEKEKLFLAQVTELKIGQINNWLINARRRILPAICHEYGLDHSKAKVLKRSPKKMRLVKYKEPWSEMPHGVDGVEPSDMTRGFSSDYPLLEYLADVMLVDEEFEKFPNREGLSKLEVLCRRGLGERLYPCSP